MYRWSKGAEPAITVRQHVIPAPPGLKVWCVWKENRDMTEPERYDVLALGFELRTVPYDPESDDLPTTFDWVENWALAAADCENPWVLYGIEGFHTEEGALKRIAERRRGRQSEQEHSEA